MLESNQKPEYQKLLNYRIYHIVTNLILIVLFISIIIYMIHYIHYIDYFKGDQCQICMDKTGAQCFMNAYPGQKKIVENNFSIQELNDSDLHLIK